MELLQIGDMVEVMPSDKVPADGTVVRGSSSIDESAITATVDGLGTFDMMAMRAGRAPHWHRSSSCRGRLDVRGPNRSFRRPHRRLLCLYRKISRGDHSRHVHWGEERNPDQGR
ncbi:hypothetical protein H4582DRAFT_1971504, partial [Lactarius indigo]